MKTYLECWAQAAAALLPQAVAGEPEWFESAPRPLGAGAFGFTAMLAGDLEGCFSIFLSDNVLESPLLGDGVDQKAAWGEILREILDAAAGDMLASAGVRCRVQSLEEIAAFDEVPSADAPAHAADHGFTLQSGGRSWTILVRDQLASAAVGRQEAAASAAGTQARRPSAASARAASAEAGSPSPRPGLELLLDVELEASLRFGSRELPLGDILELGPGDVVQLDRHVADPVDLIVGDKIVARGEVVLVSGNFGLRVTEVAAPRKRLESIRCLF